MVDWGDAHLLFCKVILKRIRPLQFLLGHSYLRIHYLVVPPEFSLNKKMLKFFLLVYKRTNSISYAWWVHRTQQASHPKTSAHANACVPHSHSLHYHLLLVSLDAVLAYLSPEQHRENHKENVTRTSMCCLLVLASKTTHLNAEKF